MRKTKRKPIPQFELGYKDEAFKLTGEIMAVTGSRPPPLVKAQDTNQLEMLTEQIDHLPNYGS
jgi:hypothetical protein